MTISARGWLGIPSGDMSGDVPFVRHLVTRS